MDAWICLHVVGQDSPMRPGWEEGRRSREYREGGRPNPVDCDLEVYVAKLTASHVTRSRMDFLGREK